MQQTLVLDGCSSSKWQVVWVSTSRPEKEKTQNYCSSCMSSSSVLLRRSCRCCKRETELLMNTVNRFQDPILPGNDLESFFSCIEFKKCERSDRQSWNCNYQDQYLFMEFIFLRIALCNNHSWSHQQNKTRQSFQFSHTVLLCICLLDRDFINFVR